MIALNGKTIAPLELSVVKPLTESRPRVCFSLLGTPTSRHPFLFDSDSLSEESHTPTFTRTSFGPLNGLIVIVERSTCLSNRSCCLTYCLRGA